MWGGACWGHDPMGEFLTTECQKMHFTGIFGPENFDIG